MNNKSAKPSFWEIYTPRNIWLELRYRFRQWAKNDSSGQAPKSNGQVAYTNKHSTKVGQFYDTNHDAFQKVYGAVIQAFRTTDVSKLLDYQVQSIGFEDGQKVLDAGCGLAAPAIHFAQKKDLQIDAITISKEQYETACQRVKAANLDQQVRVHHGDYHQLPHYFEQASYDVVYFLESFGHSSHKKHLIDGCWEMLKPGGTLYIKDLFRRIPLLPDHAAKIDHEIKKINAAYCYEVAELNTVLDYLRQKGFILAQLKTIDLKLEDFENLAISNEFQELTGIALIEDWNTYVFPVDFFELKCIKPQIDLDKGLDRYFLQNLYYLQVKGRSMEDL